MARDPEPEQPARPTIVEREINLALLNDKLNEVLYRLERIAQANNIDLTD